MTAFHHHRIIIIIILLTTSSLSLSKYGLSRLQVEHPITELVTGAVTSLLAIQPCDE